MTTNAKDTTTVLVLRDDEGNYYLLTEQQIHAHRATPEQQAALREKIGDQDVAGFATTGGLGSLGTIVVAPQTNVNVGLNIALFSPNAQQSLGQAGLNNLVVGTPRR